MIEQRYICVNVRVVQKEINISLIFQNVFYNSIFPTRRFDLPTLEGSAICSTPKALSSVYMVIDYGNQRGKKNRPENCLEHNRVFICIFGYILTKQRY